MDAQLRDHVTAQAGTLIYSEDSQDRVTLKQELSEGVTKFSDLVSGNFQHVSNTKRTLEIIRKVAHKPLFEAFGFRKD